MNYFSPGTHDGHLRFPVQAAALPHLPRELILAVQRCGILPSRFILTVRVATQTMCLFEKAAACPHADRFPRYAFRQRYLVSTSAYGVGQVMKSQQTPLGLHRIAEKIGGGQPVGTVFRNRKVAGLTWQGEPEASIVHRILWLEGLEPGFNRGGNVDTHRRFIYIHGFGDETTLGHPQSHGCIHLAAQDLIPLFDFIPEGTLVWIAER